MNPIVRFDNVSKRYSLGLTRTSLPALAARAVHRVFSRDWSPRQADQVLWALKDVSFELARGESMALVGPNGAGKSTLLKLLSKITLPTEGRIGVHGRLSALIELGSGFHPDLTGRENIYLNGSILGLSRQDVSRRFDEIVAFSELEHFIDTPIKRYSSGMEVRLGFSVAACIEPEILLVDEVLSVGDTAFREKSLHRIRKLIDQGTSIIFVSHNLYMVQAVCRTGLYLQHGEVRRAGEISGVIQAYEQDIHLERAAKMRRQKPVWPADAAAGAVELIKVTVQNPTDTDSEALETHRPARVAIHYRADQDTTRVNVAAFIIRSDGVLCCMIRSKLDNVAVRLARGTGTLSFDVDPLQLLPGTYYAEVVVTDETDSIRLTAHPTRSAWFTVSGRVRNPGLQAGVFDPCVRWQAPQTSPAADRSELLSGRRGAELAAPLSQGVAFKNPL